MEFSKKFCIFSSVLVLVAANDFEIVEEDFVQHFGNEEHPIKWSVAKHFYDFKTLVKICDQMKILRNETAVITDLRVNADENRDQETGENPNQETGKNPKQQVLKNPNLGRNPGVLLFRNKKYKSRMIDVLRCEIANSKHHPTGRRYIYIGKGKTRKSYYLLAKAEMMANEYFLERYEFPKSEPDPATNGPLLASTAWSADI